MDIIYWIGICFFLLYRMGKPTLQNSLKSIRMYLYILNLPNTAYEIKHNSVSDLVKCLLFFLLSTEIRDHPIDGCALKKGSEDVTFKHFTSHHPNIEHTMNSPTDAEFPYKTMVSKGVFHIWGKGFTMNMHTMWGPQTL